jgi:hypothetical protein
VAGHAMIRPSFVPPRGLRELRDLTRRRRKMIGVGTSERNRVDKILQDANVKLSSALSDIFGVSGQLMLEARCWKVRRNRQRLRSLPNAGRNARSRKS